MSDADEILIGEGVALESGAAPVTLRMLSGLIDAAVTVIVLISLLIALSNVPVRLNDALGAALSVALTVAILIGMPAAVETLTRGRSLGRFAAGLRIVRDDGGPITLRHAIVRALVGVLEIYMLAGVLAVTVSMLSSRGKRVGDYLSGTYAMRTRGGGRALAPLAMPAHLAGWAATADIARLPDTLALTGRLFLGRAPGLHPDARSRLGNQLAAEVSRFVAPAPPPGTHPEYFLAAVLAARRDREYALELARLGRADAEAARVGVLPFGIVDADT